LCLAFFGLIDSVVLVFPAVPVTDTEVPFRIVQLHIRLPREPRFLKRWWIVHPDVGTKCFVVDLLPDLYSFHVFLVVRLRSLIDSRLQLIGCNDEFLPVPESNRVAVIERVPVCFRQVVAAIGVDSSDVIDHFINEPRLTRRDDEFTQKRLCKPTRVAGRRASRDRVPFDAAFRVFDPFQHLGMKFRSQFSCGKAVGRLIGIECKTRNGSPSVHAAPIGEIARGEALPTLRIFSQRLIKLPCSLLLTTDFDHLFLGPLRLLSAGPRRRGPRLVASRQQRCQCQRECGDSSCPGAVCHRNPPSMRSILQIACLSKNSGSLEAVGLNVEQRSLFPSFEEGWPRRSRKCNATSDSARPGRSDHCCTKVLPSPAAPYLREPHVFLT